MREEERIEREERGGLDIQEKREEDRRREKMRG